MSNDNENKPSLAEMWDRLSEDGSRFEGYELDGRGGNTGAWSPIDPDQAVDADSGEPCFSAYRFVGPGGEYGYSREEMQAFYDKCRW